MSCKILLPPAYCVHAGARQQDVGFAYISIGKTRVTTSYVLAEYVALALVRGLSHEKVLTFSAEVLTDGAIEIIWVDEALHTQAVELMQARRDKTYSLCDAVSFVLMLKRGITDALTTDKHFEQEGFIKLLAS